MPSSLPPHPPALRAALACLAVVVGFVACSTVPETGRQQLSFVPDNQVVSMGLSEFEKYKKSNPISRDPGMNAAVQRVAKRLTPVIALPGAQWELVVFQDDAPNAFALPGGKVGVHTGIFKITKNDAGLAAVIGHEVGHVVAKHSSERLSHGLLAAGVGAGLDAVLRGGDGVSDAQRAAVLGAYGAGTTVGAILPFSRKQELEADRLGTIYMARAGYDPREAVAFWKRFGAYNKQHGRKTPEFLSTHPLDAKRVAALEAFMPEALAEFHRATGQRGASTPTPAAPRPPSSSPPRARPYRG